MFLHGRHQSCYEPGTENAQITWPCPDGWEPVAALAMGYLGDPATLPDSLRVRETAESQRKPQTAFVFGGEWGKAAEFSIPQA